KYFKDGKWSEPIAVTGANEDIVRCAIAAEGDGTVWVTYCSQRNGNHAIYTRSFDESNSLSQELQLTPAGKRELAPKAITRQNGEVMLAFQRIDSARTRSVPPQAQQGERLRRPVLRLLRHASGKWTDEISLPGATLRNNEYASGAFEWSL